MKVYTGDRESLPEREIDAPKGKSFDEDIVAYNEAGGMEVVAAKDVVYNADYVAALSKHLIDPRDKSAAKKATATAAAKAKDKAKAKAPAKADKSATPATEDQSLHLGTENK